MMLNRCYMHKEEEETIDYILLHCLKVVILWQLICALFEREWVMYSLEKKAHLSWHGSFVGRKTKKANKGSRLFKESGSIYS